jgi:diphthine-ammonia ligase
VKKIKEGQIGMKVVASWSGGKESCFACYKAIHEGFDVSCLLTMMANEGISNFHMLNAKLLDAQSQAIGIPIVKWKTTPDTYEQEFKKALWQMKAEGVKGLVTGDIYEVPLHEKGWLDRVCKEVDIKPIKPLWGYDTRQVLSDFIDEGFEATVIIVKTEVMGAEWLGRKVNKEFLSDLLKVGTIDPCGERGEYHTYVTDGPLFKKRIRILETEKMTRDGYGYLGIKRYESTAKGR